MKNTPVGLLINSIAGQMDALMDQLRLSPDETLSALVDDSPARLALTRVVEQIYQLQASTFTEIVVNGGMPTSADAAFPLPLASAATAVDGADMGESDAETRASSGSSQAEKDRRLQQMSAMLMAARQHERDQLSHRLHDLVGRNLTGLNLDLSVIQIQLAPLHPDEKTLALLADAIQLVEKLGEITRDLIAEMRPPLLDEYGLVAAIEWYRTAFVQRTGIDFIIEQGGTLPRLNPSVENGLFRVVQESLNNAAKHAGADRVIVTLGADADNVNIAIVDDGCGFDPDRRYTSTDRQRWGLIFMRECIRAFGGQLHIESTPGEGTRIGVKVPR